MAVTELLQVVPTRLIQAVRNKLIATSLLTSTCCELVGLTLLQLGNKHCEHILLTEKHEVM